MRHELPRSGPATNVEADGHADSGDALLQETKTVQQRLPVIEESLQVTKVEVDKGGYRIAKRVETREQLVDELLRDERVEIERRPMGLPLAGMDAPEMRYEGDTLIVPVVEEVLVTEKRLVLVEEVRITRVHGTHRKPQTVTLRKEEIVVDRLAAREPSSDQSS